jgi:hypothetical protein
LSRHEKEVHAMLTMEKPTDLRAWMNTAFRGEIPGDVARLMKHRDTMNTVFTEMMTQRPPELREPMEQMHQVSQAETELLYSVIENLFVRHLESHP